MDALASRWGQVQYVPAVFVSSKLFRVVFEYIQLVNARLRSMNSNNNLASRDQGGRAMSRLYMGICSRIFFCFP